MAKQARGVNGQSPKRPSLKYFFYNDKLHKKLHINRGKDLIMAWNYPDVERKNYSYTDVLRRHQTAFTTKQVCAMVNRHKNTIDTALRNGNIERPQETYGLDENKNFYQFMWREKDIMDLLEFLSSVHHGRPRKDGIAVAQNLPTPRELRAMINQETLMYVKQGDVFVPSWRAKEI